MSVKNTLAYSLFYRVRNAYLQKKRDIYLPQLKEIVKPSTTIISSNCFAGRIMQDLDIPYNSPTLGLYFMSPDYIELLSNLKYYLTEERLFFVEKSKYELGNIRRSKWSHWYPIGRLGNTIEIHFLHYYSEKEAADKWYRRCARINWDDLIIIGMEQNLCSKNCLASFSRLPFKKKVFFTSHFYPNMPDVVYIPEFQDKAEVGDPYKQGHIFYKYFIEHFSK